MGDCKGCINIKGSFPFGEVQGKSYIDTEGCGMYDKDPRKDKKFPYDGFLFIYYCPVCGKKLKEG